MNRRSLLAAALGLLLVLGCRSLPRAQAGEVELFERYPLTSAPLLSDAPTIDGQVDEAEWQNAAVMGPLLTLRAGISEELRHTVYVGYDAHHLYIAFRIRRPATAVMPQSPNETGRVDSWRLGDMVEMALDIVHEGQTYFDFVLYPNGAFADGRGKPNVDRHWDCDWRQAASLTADGWQGELAIPFQSLGLDRAPAPGTVWGFDFIDNQKSPSNLVIMSGFRGPTWHRFKNFGHLRFAAPGEPAIRYLQFKDVGVAQTVAEFELVNPGSAPATVQAQMQLLKRRAGADGGAKSFYDQVNSGTDDDYDEGNSDFTKSTKLPDLITEALARYEPVANGTLDDRITIPAGQRRGWGLLRDTGTGEMLLRHTVRSADGTLLAGMVRVVCVEPALALTLEPYWLRRQALDVTADLRKVTVPTGATLELQLRAQDDPAQVLTDSRTPIAENSREIQGTLSTAQLKPGGYRVDAILRDAAGKELARNDTAIVRPENPVWFNNDCGKSLPQPWTPVRAAQTGVVEVWGRVYDLTTVWPRSITSGGVELLTAPATLAARVGDQTLPWRVLSLELRQSDEQQALFDAVLEIPGGSLRGTVTLMFDGLLWYDLKLSPTGDKLALDALTWEMTLDPRFAALVDFHKFLHDPLITPKPPVPLKYDPAQAGRLVDLALPFSPYVWMGDERGGLAFVAEAPVDWQNEQPTGVIRITPPSAQQRAAVMQVRLIDHAVELTKPMRVQFGLQATPIRALPEESVSHMVQAGGPIVDADYYRQLAEAGARSMVFHGSWKGDKANDWGGWPSHPRTPELREKLKEAIAQAHAAGMAVTIYTGWGVSVDSDEWRNFGYEMVRQPLENSGFGTYRQSAGSNGVYADYMAWMYNELITAYDCDGAFWDSTANFLASTDIGIGTGWIDDQGRVRPAFPVLGTRELYKRVYTLTHGERKTRGLNVNHGGSIWCINAFNDIFHRGEGTPMHVKKLRDAWSPLDDLRASYDGRKIGVLFLAMNKNFKRLPMTVNRHTAVTLLFGALCKDAGGFIKSPKRTFYGDDDQPSPQLWRARLWLPMDQHTRWLPYYGQEQATTLEPSSLLSTALVSGDGQRALVVVSNLDDQPIVGARVTLQREVLGFPADAKLQVEDAILGTLVALEGSVLRLDIMAERYRFLKIWRE